MKRKKKQNLIIDLIVKYPELLILPCLWELLAAFVKEPPSVANRPWSEVMSEIVWICPSLDFKFNASVIAFWDIIPSASVPVLW